jgi:hypothetical protein
MKEMQVIEFADILDVPILKAGTHYSHNAGPVTFTKDELSDLVKYSNSARQFIRESIEQGAYPGNEALNAKLTKPIPGVLNVLHQKEDIFPETIKDRVRDVEVEFSLEEVNGEPWILEQFRNVPPDIAKTLKAHYPYRSIEYLPQVSIPGISQPKKIIRSTAFLNRVTSPAVKGQNPDLAVEFAEGESPVIVLMCDDLTNTESPTTKQEAITMLEEQNMEKQPEVTPEVDMSADLTGQLDAKEKEIVELQAQLDAVKQEDAKTVKELQAESAKAQAQIAELQRAQDAAEVAEFCREVELTTLISQSGQKYIPSPAFLKLLRPMVEKSTNDGVIEFAEGAKSPRKAIEDVFTQVLELAKNDALLVPVSELKAGFKDPDQKLDKTTMIAELQANENLDYGDAWSKIMQQHPEFLEGA